MSGCNKYRIFIGRFLSLSLMSLFSFFAPYPFLLSFFFFSIPLSIFLFLHNFTFFTTYTINFYLVFIFRDFSYMSISLLFDKLSEKLQVKLQFVSDYNNVYGYSLVVFCLFFINFINSWFHSWTIRYLFLSDFYHSFNLSPPAISSYFSFIYCTINFIINFDFLPFHWFPYCTVSHVDLILLIW